MVVTPAVVFGCAPAVLLVTENITVQLPEAGIVMPVKLNAVAPADSVFGVVPAQVPVTAPPAAVILESVSVNDAFVKATAFVLVNVRVTAEVAAG